MTRNHDDQHGIAIPESDRLEQEHQAEVSVGPDQEWPDSVSPDADEADRLEQAHEVPIDPDEDYAPAQADPILPRPTNTCESGCRSLSTGTW